MGQRRIVKWGRMRSQRGVFKKCLAGLIAFQCALHSFSTMLSTAAHSMKVGKHRPHWCSLRSSCLILFGKDHFYSLRNLLSTLDCNLNGRGLCNVQKILPSLVKWLSDVICVLFFFLFVQCRCECNMEALCFVMDPQKTVGGGQWNEIR